jgi:genome maintenance exonuclease 1
VNKEGLAKWKARVGHEEAEYQRNMAGKRGSAVHSILERFVNNEADFEKDFSPFDRHTFKSVRSLIEKNLDEVYAQEACLWSDFLKVAGRSDLIGRWNMRRSIIDYKTSKRIKKLEWIKNYFMQGSCYAVMFEERTGIPIDQIVIIIAVDHEQPQIFIEKRDDHIMDFIHHRNRYKEKYAA